MSGTCTMAPAPLETNVIPFPTLQRDPNARAWSLAHDFVDAALLHAGITSEEFATAAGIASELFRREAANV